MPVKAFLNSKFSNTHENIIFDELLKRLEARWKNSEELVILLGNFFYNNKDVDAMLIKKDAIILIDFKDFGGKLNFSENSIWTCDGLEVKGGSFINPFMQLRASKGNISHFFTENAEQIYQNKNKKISYYDIYSMVIFHRKIELKNSLPGEVKKWFFVTDIEDVVNLFSNIVNSNIYLDANEIFKIPELLDLREYNIDKGVQSNSDSFRTKSQVNHNLTDSQKNALVKIELFLDDKDTSIFILKGAAGTGKTYLINEITNLIILRENPDFKILAPTGKSARNINSKYNLEVRTIHSQIYKRTPKEDITEDINEPDEAVLAIKFDLRDNLDSDNCIYIIDESSLISDSIFKNEFLRFGSERLLNDLLKYSQLELKPMRKVIFIGDDYQMIRGKDDLSALSVDYLNKHYNLKIVTFELIEIVRQTVGNPIIQEAIKLRDAIKLEKYNILNFITDDKNIVKVNKTNQVDSFKECIKNDNINETAILKYSNSQVRNSIDKIRSGVLNFGFEIQVGDNIMFYKNYYSKQNIFISNGEVARVVEVFDKEIKSISNRRKEPLADLIFRDIVIDLFPHGKLKIKILENFLLSETTTLDKKEQQALIILFSMNNKIIFNGEQKSPSPKNCGSVKSYYDLLMADPYFNCALVKYAYAITAHKAQGSEWNNVFIDFEWKNQDNNYKEQYFRWVYTAITRAKSRVFLVNPPKITPFSKFEWNINEIKVQNDKQAIIPYSLNQDIDSEIDELLKKYENITNSKHFIKYFLTEFNSFLLQNQKSIFDIVVHNYDIIIGISKQTGEKARIKFVLNNDGDIKNPNFIDNEELGKEILNFYIKSQAPIFETDTIILSNSELNNFYSYLKQILSDKNIIVSKIVHNKYNEQIYFCRNDEYCTVGITFDSNGFFTSGVTQRTNSIDLSEDIKNCFHQLKCL